MVAMTSEPAASAASAPVGAVDWIVTSAGFFDSVPVQNATHIERPLSNLFSPSIYWICQLKYVPSATYVWLSKTNCQ